MLPPEFVLTPIGRICDLVASAGDRLKGEIEGENSTDRKASGRGLTKVVYGRFNEPDARSSTQ